MKRIISLFITVLIISGLLPATSVSAATSRVVIDEQFTMPYPYLNGVVSEDGVRTVENGKIVLPNNSALPAEPVSGQWYKSDTRSNPGNIIPMKESDAHVGAEGNFVSAVSATNTTGWGTNYFYYYFPEITGGDITFETRVYRPSLAVANNISYINLSGSGTITFHTVENGIRLGGTTYGKWSGEQWYDAKIILKWDSYTSKYNKAQFWLTGAGSTLSAIEVSITPIASASHVCFRPSIGAAVGGKDVSEISYMYIDYIKISVDGDYYPSTTTLDPPEELSWKDYRLSWTDSQTGVASYEVALYKNGTKTATKYVEPAARSVDLSSDMTDTTSEWTAKVKAKGARQSMDNLFEDSDESSESPAWTPLSLPGVPGAPTWVKDGGGNDTPTLEWTAATDASSYNVYLYKDNSHTSVTIPTPGLSIDLSGQMASRGDGSYVAEVTGVNSAGESSPVFSPPFIFERVDEHTVIVEGKTLYLSKIADYEHPDYKAGDVPASSKGVWSYTVREQRDFPFGQYAEYEDTVTGQFRGAGLWESGNYNSDTVSIRFKLYVPSMSSYDVNISPLTIRLNSNGTISFRGTGGSSDYAADTTLRYQEGWNDFEIRLFKTMSGPNQYYTHNSVRCGDTVNDSVSKYRLTIISATTLGSLSLRCNTANRYVLYLDEVNVYTSDANSLAKLTASANVSVNAAGITRFDGVENAKAYAVKLYKSGELKSTATVVPGDADMAADFYSVIKNTPDADTFDWTFSVQAKGDYAAYRNSNETFAENWEYPASPPDAPVEPKWNGTELSWGRSDADEGTYTVELYRDASPTPVKTISGIKGNSIDLLSYMEISGEGMYAAKVVGVNLKDNSIPVDSLTPHCVYDFEQNRNTEYLWNFEFPAYAEGRDLSKTSDFTAFVRKHNGDIPAKMKSQYLELERKTESDVFYSFDLQPETAGVASIKFYICLTSAGTVKINAETLTGSVIASVPLSLSAGVWHEVELRLVKQDTDTNKPYMEVEYYLDGALMPSPTITGTYAEVFKLSLQNSFGAANTVYIDEISLDNFKLNPQRDAEIVEEQIKLIKSNVPNVLSPGARINLPFSYNGAIDITWESDEVGANPIINLTTGEVRYSDYFAETLPYTPVTLTAVVAKGGESDTEQFTVNVLRKSITGNLAIPHVRKWTEANTVLGIDLLNAKKINCIVLNGLSKNVTAIRLQYLDGGGVYQTLYESETSIDSIVKLSNSITAQNLRLVVLRAEPGMVALKAMDVYLYLSYDEMLKEVEAAINLGNLSKVTNNISLPLTGEYGATITWTSENPAIDTLASPGTGIVTRPPEDASGSAGKLIAAISIAGAPQSRICEFSAIVPPLTSASARPIGGSSGSLYTGNGVGNLADTPIYMPTQLPSARPNISSDNFTDTNGNWAEAYIKELKGKGIVRGTNNGSFNPDAQITRAELLAMVIRALGLPEERYADAFGDAAAEDWYSGVIQAGLSARLISPDALFRPNDNITREEMCKIITSAAAILKKSDIEGFGGYELIYIDAFAISGWALEYVKAASSLGLMTGMDDGSFAPLGFATRAQTAAVISRLLNKYSN